MNNAIAWAGLIMLFNYCMWSGNILAKYKDYIGEKKIFKPFGGCIPCTGFWWGIPVWYFWAQGDYFVFAGISEGVLVLYTCLLLRWFK